MGPARAIGRGLVAEGGPVAAGVPTTAREEAAGSARTIRGTAAGSDVLGPTPRSAPTPGLDAVICATGRAAGRGHARGAFARRVAQVLRGVAELVDAGTALARGPARHGRG